VRVGAENKSENHKGLYSMSKERNSTSMSMGFLNVLFNNKALMILLILVVLISLVSNIFFTPKNLMNVLRQVCVSAILGIGFTIVLASGNIDLSIGSTLGMCGVVMAMLSKIEGIPFAVVIAVGILLGMAIGALNATIITLFKLPAFIITLAMQSVIKGAMYILARNAPVVGISDSFVWFGQGYVGPIPVPVIVMAIVLFTVWLILNKTVFGRHAIAMGGNLEAARNAGVNIPLIRYGVYIVVGACAAIAGLVMTGRTASGQLSAGSGMEMDAIAAVVIGGTSMAGGAGNVFGSVIGCIIVGVINNSLNLLNVNPNWQIIAKGLLIVIAVLLDSQGEQFKEKFRKRQVSRTA
jgi:ribose transport system permease protein